jgi:hypothetical protein
MIFFAPQHESAILSSKLLHLQVMLYPSMYPCIHSMSLAVGVRIVTRIAYISHRVQSGLKSHWVGYYYTIIFVVSCNWIAT